LCSFRLINHARAKETNSLVLELSKFLCLDNYKYKQRIYERI